jgi:hypothetical protein
LWLSGHGRKERNALECQQHDARVGAHGGRPRAVTQERDLAEAVAGTIVRR